MIRLITISVLLGISISCFSQNDDRTSVSAGATLSHLDGADSRPGYYVGLSAYTRISKHIGFGGDLQFVNQRAGVEDIDISVYSLSPSFNFKLYPTTKGLYVFGGVLISFYTSVKVDSESLDDKEFADLHFTCGAGYEFEKLEIVARYNNSSSEYYFDSFIQLGVNYKLGR